MGQSASKVELHGHPSQYTSNQAIILLTLFPYVQKVKMLCLLQLAEVLLETKN
jgi:hypothetical protein